MKVLVLDGVGIWLDARRLNPGKSGLTNDQGKNLLTQAFLQALEAGGGKPLVTLEARRAAT